jgi:ceramide glucosyltransferase
MNQVAIAVELVCALLTVCGVVYGLLVLSAVRSFVRAKPSAEEFAPPVTILKPVKGVDARMHVGLVSHCQQQYSGVFEMVFGVSSLSDPAVAEIARLKVEFPDVRIQLVECTERLGTNGKVSNLAQMLPHARYEHVVVNDSDIQVGPQYLQNVMRPFADARVGLVTAPSVGRAERTLWSKLEALGIATDFMPGVLVARKLEGGIRFGLGSTLATTKTALRAMGGFEALVDQLADDYELGVRLAKAGYTVELAREVVGTTVPAYTLRGFCEHQLRWSRSTRDSRRGGYVGLGVTYVLPWAMATVLASGVTLWSVTLLSVALLVRVATSLTVGVGLLRDEQVLRDLWLLPVRDLFGLFFWAWSYAGDTIVWRGEQFRLRGGKLVRA